MFQWVEKTETSNSSSSGSSKTKYYYEKEWSSSHMNQDSFHDSNLNGPRNPSVWPFKEETIYNERIDFGKYFLAQAHIDRLNDYKSLDTSSINNEII